jgi:hypothetical protein
MGDNFRQYDIFGGNYRKFKRGSNFLSFYRVGSFLPLNSREFYRLSNETKKWKVVILKMLKKLQSEVLPDPGERRHQRTNERLGRPVSRLLRAIDLTLPSLTFASGTGSPHRLKADRPR